MPLVQLRQGARATGTAQAESRRRSMVQCTLVHTPGMCQQKQSVSSMQPWPPRAELYVSCAHGACASEAVSQPCAAMAPPVLSCCVPLGVVPAVLAFVCACLFLREGLACYALLRRQAAAAAAFPIVPAPSGMWRQRAPSSCPLPAPAALPPTVLLLQLPPACACCAVPRCAVACCLWPLAQCLSQRPK